MTCNRDALVPAAAECENSTVSSRVAPDFAPPGIVASSQLIWYKALSGVGFDSPRGYIADLQI